MWSTFTEAGIKSNATAVMRGNSTLRNLPSYDQVMMMPDLKIEVLSLLPAEVREASVCMTKNEVRYLVRKESKRPLQEGEAVPGMQLPNGMFEDYF